MQTPSLVVIVALVASASAAAQQAQTSVRPVASVRQLHDLIITPASDAVFQAGGDAPTTNSAWLDARNQALLLAESGNLLMLGSRAPDNATWMRMSRAMVDAAAAAAAAAERNDAAALAAAGEGITTACEACHQPYRDRGRQMGTPP